MTLNQSISAFLLLFVGFSSCDREEEKIPSYLYIDQFSFSVRPGEGSANQRLSDAWLYVSNTYYGAYELPAWIPVLEEGLSDILILPGYRQNGAITNAFKYSLLNPYTTKIKLEPKKTDTIRPTTSYQDGLKFSTLEDFNGNHLLSKDRDGDQETQVLLSTTQEAFEGSNSGLIELTSAHPAISAEYVIDTKIPQSGDPIILEFNYKSDIPFSIGFIAYKDAQGSQSLLNAGVLPNKDWTKLYFDFREILNNANSDFYHLAIAANFRSDTAKSVQRILIDNIKVIHR
ncbi:MAG: hypothetical protein IPO16_07610 [Saprospiraceae bacterium]|nr:hypothetical protein [Saprospiraceae bacterium]